jgi:hypothetical protein
MSNIAMQGGATGTGTVTLLAPVTNTNRTINLPDSNGTVLTTATAGVPINGPAFSAYQSSAQTLTSGTSTKITFTTEVFDTNNNFASSTFTPTVAGYYQINCGISVGTTANVIVLWIYKNGSIIYKAVNTNSSTVSTVSGSGLVYCNGSTDYIEVYGLFIVGQDMATGQAETYFNGAMVRSAT